MSEVENIHLDSDKHRVEKEMEDKEDDLEFIRIKNSELSDDLKVLQEEYSKLKSSIDIERISLWDVIRRGIAESDALKSGFEKERRELEEMLKTSKLENDWLKSELGNERQRLSEQAKDFAEEKEKIKRETCQVTKELLKERQQYWRTLHNITSIIHKQGDNMIRTSSTNVQIGNLNTIEDELVSQLQELIDKLSLALVKQVAKRQELEKMLSKNKVMLKEMQDSINKIADNLKKSRSKLSKEDRELLVFLTADRSDEHVITEGIKQFSQVRKDKKNLPLAVDAMIERLLNKLGSITCGKFVQILEGRKHTLYMEMEPDDTDQTEDKHLSIKSEPENPLQQFDNDIPLDKCLCVEILSNWLLISDENDHLNLLGKIKAYESKLSADLIIKYENELRSIYVSSGMTGIQSPAENKSQHKGFDRPPPDAISQFMHQLEGLKIIIDIDRKVDAILEKIQENNS